MRIFPIIIRKNSENTRNGICVRKDKSVVHTKNHFILAALEALQLIDDRFKELEQKCDSLPFPEAYNQVVSQMHALTAAVFTAQQSGFTSERIRGELSNSWRIFGESSFVGHLQSWPRGYPGDFDAINMILDRCESAPLNTISGIIGNYALNTTIAQQHREKIAIQSATIKHPDSF
jgi:hypothetical protein